MLSHCIGSASTALGFGLLAGAALPLGAALGTFWKLPERAVAGVMAFGAGTLIAALALVLMEDAHRHGGLLFAALGFLAGAVLYTIADALIKRLIGMRRRAAKQAEQSGVAIAVGSLMDNVPEGVVIGIGVLSGGASPALLAAVFLSNLPEALASAARMREAGHHAAFIMGIWSAIGVLCGLAAWAGFLVFRSFSDAGIAIASAVAAGAIVAMLVDTLIPEAYEGAHDYSGLVTAAGFLLAFALHKTSA